MLVVSQSQVLQKDNSCPKKDTQAKRGGKMNSALVCGLMLLSLIQGRSEDKQGQLYSVIAAAEQESLPIMVMAFIESKYQYDAVSPVGALGLMQLMPIAVEEVYLENKECDLPPPGKFDYYNPFHSAAVGACYFRYLMARFNGNESLAVAAYNAGPTFISMNKYKGWPNETKDYLRRYKKYRRMEVCKG